MITDSSFIPVSNPDLTNIEPSTIGLDTTITTETIKANSQPFEYDYTSGSLNINAFIATIGNTDLISPLPNPNLSNQLVVPALQVGGTIMANDIILGNSGTTNLISDNTGTYIYGDVNVSGLINNTYLQNKFAGFLTKDLASTTYQLSGNYLTNASLFQLSGNYPTIGTTLLNNYNTQTTTASILSNYPTIGTTLLTNYNTQTTTASILSNYPTLGTTLLNNYNTQTTTTSILSNYATLGTTLLNNYNTKTTTVSILTNYPTIGTTLLTNYNTQTTTASILSNYITSGSLSTYQTVANMANYVTSSSIATTLGSFLTIANASSGYLAKPWVGGRFNVTLSTVSSIGQQSFVPTRNSTGQYTITWANPHPNGINYTILASVRGAANISYGIPVSTNLQLYCYNQGTSNYIDLPQDCSFTTIP